MSAPQCLGPRSARRFFIGETVPSVSSRVVVQPIRRVLSSLRAAKVQWGELRHDHPQAVIVELELGEAELAD